VGSSVYLPAGFIVSARFEYADTEIYDQRSFSLRLSREW
jgi:hypothetical protein